VASQHAERGLVTAIVRLGDPATAGFGGLVDRLRRIPLVRSVRVRLAGSLAQGDQDDATPLDQPAVIEHLALLARHDLVATVEATSDQLEVVARLARELPDLKFVVDHFGWPTDLSEAGRCVHSRAPRRAGGEAECRHPPRRDRDDLRGWTVEQVRPWLLAVVAQFGPDRCMLGSDLPIERLRSGFEPLYRAYDEIFAQHAPRDRELLLRVTAEEWYGAG
jgi:predicted TIM-barrel fold metal-dependent hydrolase